MNERIRELAKQATNYIDPTINGGVCWELDQQKFAELIVRECAEVGSKFSMAHPQDISYNIKKHFGVKERMNERLKQLAEQAEKYADDNFKGQPTYSEAYDSKFAELIVRECVDTVSDCSIEYCTRPQIVSEIKQHFGVK